MYFKGTKSQCDLYNNFVSQEIGLVENDKWSSSQELTDGSWVILAHPSFPSFVMGTINNPEFK
jgi:hypothetical protein